MCPTCVLRYDDGEHTFPCGCSCHSDWLEV